MAALTLADFVDRKIEVKKIQFLGKDGYIRDLSFDSQMEIAQKFSKRSDDEASADDMKMIIAYTLCDEEGNLIFENPVDALKILGKQKADELVDLFNQIQDVNGLSIEKEIKN